MLAHGEGFRFHQRWEPALTASPQRKVGGVNGPGANMTFQYGALKLRQGWLGSQRESFSCLGTEKESQDPR